MDYSKTKTVGRSAVRQVKGPGMNLGLKKRQRFKKPQNFIDPADRRPRYATNMETGEKPSAKKSGKHSALINKGFF